MSHTPGPWQWADVPGAGIQIRGPYKDSTRLIFQDIWRAFPEAKWDAEMEANAQLASAAPELLEALQALAALYDTDEGCRSMPEYIQARAAIVKATGSAA